MSTGMVCASPGTSAPPPVASGWLSRVFRRARAVTRARHAAPAWAVDIARVIQSLRETNAVTEADFLAVGEKLIGFLASARQLRTGIGLLADDISGGAGERACAALATVLVRSSAMKSRAEETSQGLNRLPAAANNVRRGFSGFEDVVTSFQLVATLSRIETARLGTSQTELSHLADEVRTCTQKIQNRVEHALESAAGLEDYINLTMLRVSEVDSRQLKALPALVAAVERSLRAFRLRQQKAGTTSVRLGDEFKAFSEAIGGLVGALQVHDGTRQQVEHVVESLERILGTGNAGDRTPPPPADEFAVIDLQRQQLLSASKAFGESVRGIKLALERIAAQGREMQGEMKCLLDLAEDQHTTFFHQMEQCFEGVLASVSGCAALDVETTAATAELRLTIDRLHVCVKDIGAIELEINNLALNATIKAIHLGTAGEPLSIIAGAMQTLHTDASVRSRDTEKALGALNGMVESMLQPEGPPATEAGSGNTAVTREMRTRIDELHAASERGLASSKELNSVAASLSANVQSASDNFTVGALFDDAIHRCCGILERVTAGQDSRRPRAAGAVEHLATRYTMQTERDVHERATAAGRPDPRPPDQTCVVAVAAGDLGENVELF